METFEYNDWYHGKEIEEYSSIPYSYLHPNSDGKYVIYENMSYSDYSGRLENKANLETFQKKYPDFGWEVYGDFGYTAILFDKEKITEEMQEDLDYIIEGNILDEDYYYKLFFEQIEEEWNDWIRYDFVRGLREKFDEDLVDELEDEKIKEIFEAAREKTDEWYINEEGVNLWIRLDPIIKKVESLDV